MTGEELPKLALELPRPKTDEPRGLAGLTDEEPAILELKPRLLDPEAPLNEVPPREDEELVGLILEPEIPGRATEGPVGLWNLDLPGSLGVAAAFSAMTLLLTVASVVTSTSLGVGLPKVGRRPPLVGKERLALGGALEARVAVTVGVMSSVLLTMTAALD